MMYSLNHTVLGCLFVLFTLNSAVKTDLEVVNDDELLNLIRTENYVVVLFTKKKCDNPDCEKFETELTNAREELVDNLNAWVVKAVNSPLYRLYSTSEPCILFFRMGVPLLYDGEYFGAISDANDSGSLLVPKVLFVAVEVSLISLEGSMPAF
ncbi:uncharacterized protein LOC103519797 [Diaphorina citri]|uniref:Uncharacterized protein LOC103519797 n=1 Tax=Diaphorina citri TaxID=121845 RepID=A0A1S3DKX3_DIACI|nr:uncharacterized protein LOC103519797 [Diaphorina citri]